jgi:hypothetical protein
VVFCTVQLDHLLYRVLVEVGFQFSSNFRCPQLHSQIVVTRDTFLLTSQGFGALTKRIADQLEGAVLLHALSDMEVNVLQCLDFPLKQLNRISLSPYWCRPDNILDMS